MGITGIAICKTAGNEIDVWTFERDLCAAIGYDVKFSVQNEIKSGKWRTDVFIWHLFSKYKSERN